MQARDLETAVAGQAAGVKGLLSEANTLLARLIKIDEKSADAATG